MEPGSARAEPFARLLEAPLPYTSQGEARMSEPTQSRPIPVGILVSVTDSRAKARTRTMAKPHVPRAAPPGPLPLRARSERAALLRQLPWCALVIACVGAW